MFLKFRSQLLEISIGKVRTAINLSDKWRCKSWLSFGESSAGTRFEKCHTSHMSLILLKRVQHHVQCEMHLSEMHLKCWICCPDFAEVECNCCQKGFHSTPKGKQILYIEDSVDIAFTSKGIIQQNNSQEHKEFNYVNLKWEGCTMKFWEII